MKPWEWTKLPKWAVWHEKRTGLRIRLEELQILEMKQWKRSQVERQRNGGWDRRKAERMSAVD